jgi:hypothetical protein
MLKTVKWRRVLGLDFLFFGPIALVNSGVSPAINISVIGHYKSAERPCLMTSVERCVKNRLGRRTRHALICAMKSIRDRPINANKHKEGTFYKHLDHLFGSQVPRNEVGTPVPSDVFEEFCYACKP